MYKRKYNSLKMQNDQIHRFAVLMLIAFPAVHILLIERKQIIQWIIIYDAILLFKKVKFFEVGKSDACFCLSKKCLFLKEWGFQKIIFKCHIRADDHDVIVGSSALIWHFTPK